MKNNETVNRNYDTPAMLASVMRREICVILIALLFGSVGTGYGCSQSANKTMLRHIERNDLLSMTIKGRAIADLKRSADPESAETRLIAPKTEALTQEKKDSLEVCW
ncbi:MAG TPA: hypothetical protein VJ044_17350 [Candidatus Hodarchaeales archaeon]|nr:hypothetical protein [Candidatus Hodarchaeales archaeon]